MEVLEGLKNRKQAALASMVQDFERQMEAGLPNLESAVSEANYGSIQRMAHAMKESALSIAAARLVELCETLELQAMSFSLDEPRQQVKEIEFEYQRVSNAFDTVL